MRVCLRLSLLWLSLFECVTDSGSLLLNRQRAAAAGGAYVHGKGGTYWRPLFNAQGEFC